MRQCCQCGVADRDLGGEHLVVPEIRYLSKSEELTTRLAKQAWNYRIFQGRPAMERMICRPCLVENEMRERVWTQMRKQATALERESEDNYYELLCAD